MWREIGAVSERWFDCFAGFRVSIGCSYGHAGLSARRQLEPFEGGSKMFNV
jgi:hypothetical protein